METTSDIQVSCLRHPTENIQRVNPNINSKSHVFCVECLLEETQHQSSKDLLSIPEFLTIADDIYKKNQQKPATNLKVPPEYISALDEQNKTLTELRGHLLQEKHKINQLFGNIKKEFRELLEAQREECLTELDQQLQRLQYWHVFFGKKLRRTYSDHSTIFNSLEEPLINTLKIIKDPLEFEAYIRSIKEDLNEEILKINSTKPFDQDKKFKLPFLHKRLLELQSTKPTYNITTHKATDSLKQELIDVKNELQTQIKDLLDILLTFNNPIPDVLDDCNCPGSQIIESSQYPLLRSWFPEEHKHQNLQLLYRGTRDGMNSIAFHKTCDNKGPTLALIHCTFYRSSKESIIGGFLDKDWTDQDEWIMSDKAFLFSLTAKAKCPISSKAATYQAAHGKADLGPSFGPGYALKINADFGENSVSPGEFEFANCKVLIDRKNQEPLIGYEGSSSLGMNHFEIHEIEVYTFK